MAIRLPRRSVTSRLRTRGLGLRIERAIGITVTGLIVIAIVVIGLTLSRLLSSRPMSLLAYGLLLLILAAYVLGRRKLPVEAQRSTLPMRVRRGQKVDAVLTLSARRRVTSLILEEGLPESFGTTVRLPIPVLSGGKEIEHPYAFVPTLRGVYQVGPLVAVTTDAFGLTRRRQVLAEATEVIVHPLTESAHDRVISREWEDPPQRPPLSKPWPSGFEFYGMREYSIGDDPRRIVWRAAARSLDPTTGTGTYLVRESEQGITDRVSLVLDVEDTWHSPGLPSDTVETAVNVVASLGAKHLKDGFSVTIHTNHGRIADTLRGPRARLPMLDALARVTPTSVPLTDTLRRVIASPRQHAHLVLVAPEVDDNAARMLRVLLDRGSSVMVVLVRWDESDPGSVRRVASLGANFVEVHAGMALERAFSHVLGAGVRR